MFRIDRIAVHQLATISAATTYLLDLAGDPRLGRGLVGVPVPGRGGEARFLPTASTLLPPTLVGLEGVMPNH
jgi:hypothetical protein